MSMGKTRVRTSQATQRFWIKNFKKKEASGEYEPFYRTQDITSSGIKGRIPCPNNPGRVYHTLSLNETYTLVQLLQNPLVENIKEQYAETDLAKTKAFAKEFKIKHPTHTWSSTDSVITWDFLCDMKIGPRLAISVKPRHLLNDRRTVEKLKLEKALAQSLGYEHIITTDDQVKTEAVQNIFRILRGANLEPKLSAIYPDWITQFKLLVTDNIHTPISVQIEKLADRYNINFVESFTLMQHGFWVRDITSDPEEPIYPEYSPYILGMKIHA
ncbi:TnsA endonuclease N-terminal domain-containing protein [Pseudoalteromonas aurantia]|uniref:TnsA endonuclease N-terminal domain-containing protein n=1 Tax=Pseudoalteromonas aurantia 208 TaxID=1314867 RepID=A0ABR9EFB0_9GAMM|nr:TnsA endonuclease N-terminal domain-containing protein [Pseudoalteromonas aurantia]MBE0369661.1 hypothetical protein [Pseudoalteromonas aurantia 208]